MGKKSMADDAVTDSSGNVFDDLDIGYTEQDLMKVRIAHAITKAIQKKGLTQAQAGELIGIDQPKVSALVRGRLEQFSVDRLFSFLELLGLNVDIRISPAPKARRGRVTVAA